ncbi:hypothetical protein [Methylobacterium sp. B4]|uniref:hypothetical protein n=1 Tax=Methylobacterium sp. B4 TaxID=1938755 RepID=UPI000D75C100|nr:hypothetical protein [Methylobacterium sp. B4]PXW57492.1 hypothetical protein BY998_11489 [Methylobacterium sp. B4]
MACAVAAARADEVETLVEQYLESSRGNALVALRQAVSDALVDAIECRQKLAAAERTASRGFRRQMPVAATQQAEPSCIMPSGASPLLG